ncbi:MAG TPA: hypothetical protein DCY27_14660 [Desulfobacterales bacterium]|nr:hypothetical protein [Desulfobacterales bacterium]
MGRMKEKLIEVLGLEADTNDEEIITRVKSIRYALGFMEDMSKLLGVEANAAKIKIAVLGLKNSENTVVRLQGEIDRLKAERASDKAREAVEQALKAGKILPSERSWAQQFAETNPLGFETYIGGAPIIGPVDRNLHDQNGYAGKTEPGLSTAELAIAKLLLVTPEQFKISKESLAL